MKKILSVVVLTIMLFSITGCNTKLATKSTKENDKTNVVQNDVDTNTSNEDKIKTYAEMAEEQMAMPKEGETIAIMKIKDFGEIKFKFFDNVAPKAVENFITHSKNGYYNGLTFHRVINEFMIQGGDPTARGTGGESIYGKGFGVELDKSLVPYRGSLCMAMSRLKDSIGSQFFITQANYNEKMAEMMIQGNLSKELVEQYKIYGGYIPLYMEYTVFGQAYEGLDVLDKIAAVETHTIEYINENGIKISQQDVPVKDVIIEKIEITEYKGN